MKRFIEQARGKAVDIERLLDDRMNRWVRASSRRAEPLELRNAILREIEEQLIAGPKGSNVFPYDEVTIEVLADLPARHDAVEAMFDAEGGLEGAVRTRMAERDCRLSPACAFHIRAVTTPPEGWPTGAPYRLRFRRRRDGEKRLKPQAPPVLMLTLSPGGRSHTYRLGQERVDIGRVAEVRDREGRFLRRNAICISDEHDPKGTVSRRHAHIKAVAGPDGRVHYMLYDDGSSYGTRVVRKGETVVVHPGTLGVRLRDRDQLHFGDATAVVRISTS